MPLTSPTWPANWAPIPAVGDFDGDGRADLVGLVTAPAPLNGVVTIFSHDSPLGWEIDGEYDIGGSGGWGAVHAVDLDSDGFPDLAVCSAGQFALFAHTALDCNQNGLFDPEEVEDDPSIEEVNCQAIDTDEDGLSDEDELLLGTDPFDPDTDGDGLLDGTEVDIAAGTGCPDPLDADSDDDGLADGEESLLGTDSCNADSDNDGIPDGIDPLPLDSGGTQDALEVETRDLCDFILGIELQLFSAPNNNARHGRRTALCNKSTSAANMIAAGNNAGSIMKLQHLLELLSGAAPNGPWMLPSLERDYVISTATDIIVVLEFL